MGNAADKSAQFDKGAGVEQALQPLARVQLAAGVVAGEPRLAAHGLRGAAAPLKLSQN